VTNGLTNEVNFFFPFVMEASSGQVPISLPYLIRQRQRWFVRMVVPHDVREVVDQKILKVPTGLTDEHRAAAVALLGGGAGLPFRVNPRERLKATPHAPILACPSHEWKCRSRR
jgi:hypothetical protein